LGRKAGTKMKRWPSKVWLIQGQHAATGFKEPAYSTDPREYGLPGVRQVSDEEYAAMASRVKVFQTPDEAIDFCYACGFEFTQILGFRFHEGAYHPDEEVTNEVLDSPW
jgi:hypothetical protein